MYLTYFDSNSWLIEIADKRILLDPWLVGSLTFGNMAWLFKGEKCTSRAIPDKIDLILLSQGLEDHAHPPTLQALDRVIPVVGSPGAIKVAQSLHYQQAIALEHGETYHQLAGITIKAVPGSPIGPQLVENGYLIEDLTSGHKLYYEPHGYHASSLKQETPIDVAIVPIVDLKLPLLGLIIRGQEQSLKLCEWLRPQVIVPTAAGGDVQFSGLLTALLSSEGEAAAFQKMLADKGLSTEVLDPKPGERFSLNLEPHPASHH